MIMPGDRANMIVSLDKPVALEAGSRFAIREAGKTVGSGVITEVLQWRLFSTSVSSALLLTQVLWCRRLACRSNCTTVAFSLPRLGRPW
jgi:elongation factor Tu